MKKETTPNHYMHGTSMETEAGLKSILWGMALEDAKKEVAGFENPNYPTLTPQDLRIATLERENNAAFERIQELSAAMVALGYDPTSKKL